MQDLSLSISLTNTKQIELLRQQVDFVLLLGSQLVMRSLDELELLHHHDKLTFLLLGTLLQGCCLFRGVLQLGARTGML